MTSAYGDSGEVPDGYGSAIVRELSYIPIETITKNGNRVTIDYLRTEEDMRVVMDLLNQVIIEGMSWPFENELSESQFKNYFFSHAALVARNSSGVVMGAFYCKPNFPGRCSHFCNGGFITAPQYRGKGIATVMGQVFLRVAKDIGFEAVMFNLVFSSNIASIRLWEKLGFQRMACIPRLGRLKEGTFDAIQYYYDLNWERNKSKGLLNGVGRILRRHGKACLFFLIGFISGRK